MLSRAMLGLAMALAMPATEAAAVAPATDIRAGAVVVNGGCSTRERDFCEAYCSNNAPPGWEVKLVVCAKLSQEVASVGDLTPRSWGPLGGSCGLLSQQRDDAFNLTPDRSLVCGQDMASKRFGCGCKMVDCNPQPPYWTISERCSRWA